MIGLDTNVLLRALVAESLWPDDQSGQVQAARSLVLDSGETFFVSQIVLAETVWVLTKFLRQPRTVIADIIDGLLAAANVVVDRREAVSAALAGFKAGKPGFADHLIGHVNRMAGCETTVSFDKGARGSDLFRYLPPRRTPSPPQE